MNIQQKATYDGSVFSYSDLVEYWRCPRRFGYKAIGFKHIEVNETLIRGQLFHYGIAAYHRGEVTMPLSLQPILNRMVDTIKDETEYVGANKLDEVKNVLEKALSEALTMLQRYLQYHAKTWMPLEVEERLYFGSAAGTPDLIALQDKQLWLVDFKTTGRDAPDLRTYELSGQVDYYAYLYAAAKGRPISIVQYEVITPENVMSHQRPPRPERGRYMLTQVQLLALQSSTGLLNTPHFSWDCTRCPFFRPCMAREQGASDLDILLGGEYTRGESRLAWKDSDFT